MTDGSVAAPAVSEDELVNRVKRLQRDFPHFSGSLLRVQTTGGELIPFKLNNVQRLVWQIFNEIRKKRLLRVVILKGRRMGMSTLVSGVFYQKTAMRANRYAMQITHEPQSSEFLFKMVKRFHDFMPPALRPEIRANNMKLLEFNNKEGTGLNSAFRVATAGKDDIGSGQLIHFLHCSEVAKWDNKNAKTLLTAVLQTIPKKSNTSIIFESTAKGVGGEFYDRFWKARYRIWIKRMSRDGNPIIEESINQSADPNNDYTSLFLPWFVFEDNQMDPPGKFVLSNAEEKLKKQFGLNDKQVYWRRYTIANECNGSLEEFGQEHPATPEEAFLSTGRPVFDNKKIAKSRDYAKAPVTRYEILGGNFIAKPDGRFKVWVEPRQSVPYLVGADVAEGLADGDASSAIVVDWRTGDQVAEWHGKCDPDEFARFLEAIGRRYNDALLAPERNNHGLMVVTFLFNAKYPFLYSEEVPDPPGRPRKRYGWLTSNATRPLIIDNLIREVREGTHGLKSRELFEEMLAFKVQENGKYEADPGRHDDLIMGAAIAKHLRSVLLPPKMRSISGKTMHKGGRPQPNSNWA